MVLCTQGFLHKLFGAHDIRGRGSDVPGCAHADPFFLCDAVRLPRNAKPPFCAHPHSGAVAQYACTALHNLVVGCPRRGVVGSAAGGDGGGDYTDEELVRCVAAIVDAMYKLFQ